MSFPSEDLPPAGLACVPSSHSPNVTGTKIPPSYLHKNSWTGFSMPTVCISYSHQNPRQKTVSSIPLQNAEDSQQQLPVAKPIFTLLDLSRFFESTCLSFLLEQLPHSASEIPLSFDSPLSSLYHASFSFLLYSRHQHSELLIQTYSPNILFQFFVLSS